MSDWNYKILALTDKKKQTCGVGDGGAASIGDSDMALLANL